MSVFLGWMPDAQAQGLLGGLVESLREAIPADAPAHAWRTPTQWHLTLRFLGDAATPEQRAAVSAALDAAVPALRCFDSRIDALQYWPSARVLVATLPVCAGMHALFGACEQVARACGHAPEKRRPRPHLTLAYLRDRVPASRLPALPPAPAQALRIDAASLLRTIPLGYREWHRAGLPGHA